MVQPFVSVVPDSSRPLAAGLAPSPFDRNSRNEDRGQIVPSSVFITWKPEDSAMNKETVAIARFVVHAAPERAHKLNQVFVSRERGDEKLGHIAKSAVCSYDPVA